MSRPKLNDQELEELILRNEEKKQDTGHVLGDRFYHWWIDLYTKREKQFVFSDVLVFKFWSYTFPVILGYVVFFALFLWLGSIWIKRYGEAQAVLIFIMLLMWRIQILTGVASQINKKMKR